MKKVISLFTFAFVFSSLSFCQDNKEYSNALKRMFELSGSEESYKVVIKQVVYMQKSKNPYDIDWTEIEKELLKTSMSDLVEMLVPIYQKYMTIDDIKEMTKFYQTPVGQKYAKNTPLIMQESMQVGQQWGQKLGKDIEEKIKKKNQ
ncbi:MAG TPA: DUF2059 domain-containing protein [Paludibacter sp.]